MGDLISFEEARQRKALTGENRIEKAFRESDVDLSVRIASIKASIERINKLMRDVREGKK